MRLHMKKDSLSHLLECVFEIFQGVKLLLSGCYSASILFYCCTYFFMLVIKCVFCEIRLRESFLFSKSESIQHHLKL